MSALSDYRRFEEAPMIAKYEATIKELHAQIAEMTATIKDWQDSSEAYRRDAEAAQAALAKALEVVSEHCNARDEVEKQLRDLKRPDVDQPAIDRFNRAETVMRDLIRSMEKPDTVAPVSHRMRRPRWQPLKPTIQAVTI